MIENTQDAKLKALENLETESVGRKLEQPKLQTTNEWYDLKLEYLPHQGKFYREGLRFQVQAPSTKTIKYFSSMDENNPITVLDAINNLLETHIRVIDKNKILNSLDVIQAKDKMAFILFISIYAGTGNELKASIICDGEPLKPCNSQEEIKVIPSTLVHQEPTEKALTYFNSKKGLFEIKTKTLGDFVYRPLTLKEDSDVTAFIISKQQSGDACEQQFSKYIGFFINYLQDNDYQKLYTLYLKKTNDGKILSLLENMVNIDFTFEQEPKLHKQCSKCGRLANQRITKLDPLKSIFFVPNIAEEY